MILKLLIIVISQMRTKNFLQWNEINKFVHQKEVKGEER
jgi:hypothetical protein